MISASAAQVPSNKFVDGVVFCSTEKVRENKWERFKKILLGKTILDYIESQYNTNGPYM